MIGGIVGNVNSGYFNIINSYSVSSLSKKSTISGSAGGILGRVDAYYSGNSWEIENCYCTTSIYPSFNVYNNSISTPAYDVWDFNCDVSNLKGYSSKLGKSFIEDSDGTNANNPILAWQANINK